MGSSAATTEDARSSAALPRTDEAFRREGEFWTITFDGRTVRLRDTTGLRYLSILLANPGSAVPALQIAGRRIACDDPRRADPRPMNGEPESSGRPGRKAGAVSERARQSVSIALRRSLARIACEHPVLGEHFRRTIRTGTFCSYDPDPRARVRWSF